MEAKLDIDLGPKAKEYIKIIDIPKEYKRSKISIKEEKGKIRIRIEAKDAVALIATLSGVIKQLHIISSIDEMI
jgi:tRNA threonylcarbamoyladenosine modification (KEOPS) complex  Pcc1 subunit